MMKTKVGKKSKIVLLFCVCKVQSDCGNAQTSLLLHWVWRPSYFVNMQRRIKKISVKKQISIKKAILFDLNYFM